ncbi:HDOD domain-containing protein [Desulfonatronovibrio magnus]|uniref:HDOD domain-containing protein n=1 Tax=Desulfonatronovibrio magnus TaxID=698827 RepID=UPI0005EAE395|nr:HDOD domain-containing protein [Desulfonatronovibrio magnus]
MGLVNVEDIKPGMVLKEDIRDHHGRFLLGSDLTIEEKHLRIFKIWGISQVNVHESQEQESSGRYDPDTLKNIRDDILLKFPEYNPGNRLHKTLLKIFTVSRCATSDDPIKPIPENLKTDKLPPEPSSLADACAKIKDEVQLMSLPRIFFLIQEAIKDPRTSSRHIGDIISKDQALTAKLLKLVNSAFYGFPSRIDTISRAVTIIGTRQLSTLALGLSVISRFKNISPDLMNMESFWKHSIACAIAAKTLAGLRKFPNAESFFVCGLLHDIGKLVMISYYPEEYRFALQTSMNNKLRLSRAEKIYFKNHHSTVGALMAKTWKLPLKIEQAIRYHDTPSRSQFQSETTLVHMANILTIGCDIGCAGETLIPTPDINAWEKTAISLDNLNPALRFTRSQVDNIYRLLFADA